MYCAFRDHITGLTYLRNARELYEYGMYVELKEYQFYVFLDFREIRDDSEGNWSRLCQALNGAGVESLEDELKQVRYRSLNEAFQAEIKLMKGERLSQCDFSAVAVAVAAQDFYREIYRLNDAQVGVYPSDEQIIKVESRLKRLAALLKAKPVSKIAKSLHTRINALLDSPDDSRLLMAWVLLSGMEPGILERFGLDCTLQRMLDSDGARYRIGLLSALLALPEVSVLSSDILVAAACRDFLNVHESRCVEWFNKERFEELGEWLAILSLIDCDSRETPVMAVSLGLLTAENDLNYSRELAAHAGYRVGLYQRMLPERKEIVQ